VTGGYEARILTLLQTHGELHSGQIASQLGITRHTATKYLEILKAKEEIEFREVGNAKLWRVADHSNESLSRFSALTNQTDHKNEPCLTRRDPFHEIHLPLNDSEALVEANQCLDCGGPYAQAPCMVACPTHIDVPAFIREIREGRPLKSARTIFAANILGGSCARVCPVEELCEGACVLNKEGRRAIRIGRLQRYATDWALERDLSVAPGSHSKPRVGSVGVLGAGPASLSCAAELAQQGYQVHIYEKRSLPGGLVTHAIAPYKQQLDPLPREQAAIEAMGVEFHFGVSMGTDLTLEELEKRHNAIFLGLGMGNDLPLEIPANGMSGIYGSLEFIEELKLGDKRWLLREMRKRVTVIGGGNTAIDVARNAVRLGAEEVNVLYRRTRKEMPAYLHEYEAAVREGVRFQWLTAPLEFKGSGKITGLSCIYMRLTQTDDGRKSQLEPIPGTEFVLDTDMVIFAIGQQKHLSIFEKIKDLKLERGLVVVDTWGQTTARRYFAGGDCINGGNTVVQAVADGKRAACGIDRFLQGSHDQHAPSN
jgi:glutamate synthase (NADPH/NADH) small chain